MGVRVLGPLELESHRSATPGAHKERILLAITALELGRRIPAHVLVDAIWGDGPPRTATTTLRSYISRLRRTLTEADCGLELVGGPDSYGLEGPRAHVDAVAASDHLRAAVEAIKGARPHEASEIARRALSSWRGEPLVDFASEDWARPYRSRLAELELSLQELHLEAALATGAHLELLPELESLLHRHPLRERLCGLRMLALYRAGRQSDALRAYHDIHQRLGEELGLEPGPELRRLERAVLTHSPELLVAPSVSVAARPVVAVSSPPPKIRYTSKGGVHVAYRIDGSGSTDLLVLAGGLIPVDSLADEPHLDAVLRRLGRSARIIHFDRRGLGMSDPVDPGSPPTLEQWMEDALAVLDATGSDCADVLAWADGALLAVLVAAAHPERVRSLTIVNGFARFRDDDDQPWGTSREEALRLLEETVDPRVEAASFDVLSVVAPSVSQDPSFRAWWDRAGHRAASPATARALRTVILDADVRGVLRSVAVPTCVIHRTENEVTPVEHGRLLAERIPGARLVELPGADDLWWVGDSDRLVDEVERMLAGSPVP